MIEAPSGNSASAFCTVKRRPFTLILKIRVIVLLGYLCRSSKFRNAGIRENNFELALLPLDLCEEAVQIVQFDTFLLRR